MRIVYPPKPPTPAPKSPAFAELFARLSDLSKLKTAAEQRVEGRKERVSMARDKVVEEEGKLAEAETELEKVEEEYKALRRDIERKERIRREEAQRAREPRCMELDESGEEGEAEEEEEEDEVNLEGGKKRKVIRKVRASKASLFNESQMDDLHEVLRKLSEENKRACMRTLGFGGGVNSEPAGIQEDPIETPSG